MTRTTYDIFTHDGQHRHLCPACDDSWWHEDGQPGECEDSWVLECPADVGKAAA